MIEIFEIVQSIYFEPSLLNYDKYLSSNTAAIIYKKCNNIVDPSIKVFGKINNSGIVEYLFDNRTWYPIDLIAEEKSKLLIIKNISLFIILK